MTSTRWRTVSTWLQDAGWGIRDRGQVAATFSAMGTRIAFGVEACPVEGRPSAFPFERLRNHDHLLEQQVGTGLVVSMKRPQDSPFRPRRASISHGVCAYRPGGTQP